MIHAVSEPDSDFAKTLGPPIRKAPAEKPEEWIALDKSKPHIQTNTKTGAMRNQDSRREAASAPTIWHYFGVPITPPSP